jgi:phosphatidylglycerophosphate synthase
LGRELAKSLKTKKTAKTRKVVRKLELRVRLQASAQKNSMSAAAPDTPVLDNTSTAFCIIGDSDTRLWGMTAAERASKLLAREGVTQQLTLEEAKNYLGPIVVILGDAVFDGALAPALAKQPNFILESDGQALAANVAAVDLQYAIDVITEKAKPDLMKFTVRSPEELQVSFKKSLVKRETPFALRITDRNVADVEWDMFMSTYKGATDLVTKHVWPVPAFHVTRLLAAKGVTPNLVTSVGAIAMLVAFYLFLRGHFAVGLAFAWLMTFLDTVDGKLARTTLTSSKWGDIFDHGIDLVHPPFWYLAWVYGLANWSFIWPQDKVLWILIIIFGGYILQRIMEGIAIKWLGLVIHIWRPIDTLFRKVTARRNPNLVLLSLFTVIQRPDLGIMAVAAWTVICLVLHGIQLAQALLAVGRFGSPLKSWMDQS